MLNLSGWLFLSAAILFEVTGTTLMKVSDGFTKLLPSALMFVCYGISLAALTYAVQRIEIGIAYAVWSGVGTMLITVIGAVFFLQTLSMAQIGGIALIVSGVAVLNLGGNI